ncbi:hypothetical protein O181_067206 [Austropuccinia psidii MF-1]|uniref:ribonuclease H n=1 Tax=Austropuccinia psidii MF-1 TaxID=1389203 RepID=A0A9Q3ESF7_9BASI|nr:hypothetical protein [Austropuccinia psidii MF-1]
MRIKLKSINSYNFSLLRPGAVIPNEFRSKLVRSISVDSSLIDSPSELPSSPHSFPISLYDTIMPYKMEFQVDGGCRLNGRSNAFGAAACCWMLRWNNHKGRVLKLPQNMRPIPTSQRAELHAIILALEWAVERHGQLNNRPKFRVNIQTDSQYAYGCMSQWLPRWQRNGFLNCRGTKVSNSDLIQKASKLQDKIEDEMRGTVCYRWVPRNKNELANEYATDAIFEQI